MRKSFSDLLYQYRIFFIPFLILIIFSFGLMMIFSKEELFLWINRHHNNFFDELFKLITFFGDGLTTVLIVLLLLFVKYRYAVFAAIAYAYSSLIVQILKRIFHAPRPIKYFEEISPIRTIEAYSIHQWNSFPSGHTASVFTLAVVLTFIIKDKRYHGLILPLAALTAFSRVYLAQHFVEDIIAGAILGVMLTFQLMYNLEKTKWYNSAKLNGRLFRKS